MIYIYIYIYIRHTHVACYRNWAGCSSGWITKRSCLNNFHVNKDVRTAAIVEELVCQKQREIPNVSMNVHNDPEVDRIQAQGDMHTRAKSITGAVGSCRDIQKWHINVRIRDITSTVKQRRSADRRGILPGVPSLFLTCWKVSSYKTFVAKQFRVFNIRIVGLTDENICIQPLKHSEPLTLHSGVRLFWLTSPIDPLRYKLSFLLFQTDIKKSPTLLYHELHSSFTHIPCF